MFPKKKSLPSIQPGNGASTPVSARDEYHNHQSGSSSARQPMSPHGFDFGIPTLHPSSAEASSAASSSPHSSRHARSASHPFPALLGSIGIKRDGNAPSDASGGGSTPRSGKYTKGFISSSLPKTTSRAVPQQTSEGDLVTGKCATCDATVRWPRQLDTFRCTVCHMVNNLQYGTVKEFNGLDSAGKPAAPRAHAKASPVSLDRTRSLINQCTFTYLRRKVGSKSHGGLDIASTLGDLNLSSPEKSKRSGGGGEHQARTPRFIPQTLGIPSSTPRPGSSDASRQSRSPNRTNDQTQRSHAGSSRPRTAPGQPRPSLDGIESTEARYLYRPLENYLISCMTDCDSLNMSFIIARPPGPSRGISEPHIQGQSQQPDGGEANDGFLSELDAKMLLMGDIGENARFWTGGRLERVDDEPAATSHSKTPSQERRHPRFNWRSVWQWYQSLLSCGRQWKSMRSSFKDEERRILEDPQLERQIDADLAEARHHAQRTLLKLTEKLLTHPGRPVKRPEDARFLLILLSNPLFHPRQPYHTIEAGNGANGTPTPAIPLPLEQQLPISPRARSVSEAASRGNATGHHSGVIKRILGLLGNLSHETHQVLISWLSRMPEPQHRDLVELVSGFMSYRLTRNSGRARASSLDPTNGLIPMLGGPNSGSIAQLHAAVATTADSANPSAHQTNKTKEKRKENAYADDWQVRTAARVMSLLFFANFGNSRIRQQLVDDHAANGGRQREQFYRPGQVLPVSAFYNVLLDASDLAADFEQWELKRNKFSFCQYPMFLSIWSKIRLMEYDAKRQMNTKARNAFFDTIMKGKNTSQHCILHVRRDCVVEDSLNEISHVVGSEEIKKGLKIEFEGEEGVDVGGLRKEWFLLLVREVFDPRNGLFVYDEESGYGYFNPHTFETSDQFYLIGVVLGLAIYNSTILDISLPPFLFRKLLASAPPWTGPSISAPRPQMTYTLDDLAEWRPKLAHGLRQLLEYDGDVESTFCRDFVVDIERYGTVSQVPLCHNGQDRPVTNANRREFVDLYVRYVLDTSVSRQFEPFKRGFFTVCSGNALGLFRPEEIELLVRGSDEPLDVDSLQGVAVYDNWGPKPGLCQQIQWFWQTFKEADPKDQRRLLGFITGSDRIPAMGATSLVIKIGRLGQDDRRFPIARTCFNMLGLYEYQSKAQLEHKLWTAVGWSEGFGLK